jgi:CRISPR system Cascade subunit CasE
MNPLDPGAPVEPSPGRVNLTRIPLNLRSGDVRRDLRDATGMHRRLMGLLPPALGDSPRAAAGVLYRIDQQGPGASIALLQSAVPPELSRLPSGYCSAPPETKDITAVLGALRAGQTVAYRILANPTRASLQPRLDDGTPVRGKRHAVPTAELPSWWNHQASAAGLACQEPTTRYLREPTVHASRNNDPRALHAAVRIEGIATIIDPRALREAITRGIGRGKNHGLGLLSLAPLPAR